MKIAQHKQAARTPSTVLSLGIGIGTSLLLSLLSSAIVAWFVRGEQLAQNAMNNASFPIQLVAAFAGCFVAIRINRNMPAVIAAGSAFGYFAGLVCMNVLLMDSDLIGVGKGLIAIVCGAAIAIATSLVGKGKKKYKIPKIR